MHCRAMPCVALLCGERKAPRTATCCQVAGRVALLCAALHCAALHCTALLCAAMPCIALRGKPLDKPSKKACRVALLCRSLLCVALPCTAFQCAAVDESGCAFARSGLMTYLRPTLTTPCSSLVVHRAGFAGPLALVAGARPHLGCGRTREIGSAAVALKDGLAQVHRHWLLCGAWRHFVASLMTLPPRSSIRLSRYRRSSNVLLGRLLAFRRPSVMCAG